MLRRPTIGNQFCLNRQKLTLTLIYNQKISFMSQSGSQINIDDLTPLDSRFYMCQGELLGGGSYANVYKGYDSLRKTQIAVKHVKRSDYNAFRNLFQREISVMQKLKHQNIIQFYGSLADDDGLFLFLELCQKENMKKKILQQLKEEETHKLFKQLAQGMAYMNSQKIFHRDLKPQNLLVTKKGKLKIADFGIARQFLEQRIEYTMLRCTYFYSAPQILLNYVEYNEKCDVYSAGYILYEMLTCQKIFEKYLKNDISLKSVLKQVMEKGGWTINHPSLVNKPHWSNLLKRMLQFDPKKRISFAEISLELNSLKPTSNLPIFRTISEEQQYNSDKVIDKIKNYVEFKAKRQNYLINVLKVFEHTQYAQSQFLPYIYKLLLLYVSLARYCLLSSNFIQQLSKRDSVLRVDGKKYDEVFKLLVIEDKSAVTKYLDEVAIKINKGKEQIRSLITRQILPQLRAIISNKNKTKDYQVIAEIPNLAKHIESFQEKHLQEQDKNYDSFFKKLIDNCFLTNGEIYNLGIMDLRMSLLLLIIKNYKSALSEDKYYQKNMPPTFQIILSLSKQELIQFIAAINEEQVPIWSRELNYSKIF